MSAKEAARRRLEAVYGRVWDTDELIADFEVRGFAASFVRVIRRQDGADGTMVFEHNPRFYFDFTEAK